MKSKLFTTGLAALAITMLGSSAVSAQTATTPTGTETAPSEMHQHGEHPTLAALQNVTRTATNISNGVQIQMTSTDAATVTKLQSFKVPQPPADSKLTVIQTNITNGVQLTVTSTDAETVTKIQKRAAEGRGIGFNAPGKGGKKGRMEKPKFGENVTRTVTNISNGVQIQMTSTDAATVTKLQSFKAPQPPAENEGAKPTVTQTNIENGVQITITSTNAAIVTKIQEHEKNDRKGPAKRMMKMRQKFHTHEQNEQDRGQERNQQ